MIDTLAAIAFALVFLSLIARWTIPLSRYWYLLLIGSLLVATQTELIGVSGLVVAALLLSLVSYKSRGTLPQRGMRILIDTTVATLCFTLALHIVPGFNNIPIVLNETIKSDSIPYSLFFNYDKALAGVFLITCFVDVSQIQLAVKRIVAGIGAGISANLLLLFLPAAALGLIELNIETTDIIGLWLVSNLLITCVAEEAFFRGLIQQRIEQYLIGRNTAYAAVIAVFFTSLLFGIAHLRGGWFFVATATVAGLVYGLVYTKTRRIETAIFTHYLTNTMHILFFSYPMLARS
jgi:membrane protease YdiL (CAAX protease family)